MFGMTRGECLLVGVIFVMVYGAAFIDRVGKYLDNRYSRRVRSSSATDGATAANRNANEAPP
jgi:hypothetical protein